MKVFRFMSNEEYEKLMKGENLVNESKHKAHTTSVGFCFMDLKDNPPEVAFHYLIGLVSPEVCVIFNVKNKSILNKAYGRYTDINSKRLFATCIRKEYYTTHYSKEDLEPIEVCKNIEFDYGYVFNWEEVQQMELREGMYVISNTRMEIGKIKGFCTCEMCEKRGFYEPIIDGDIIITDYDRSQGFHGYKFYDNLIDLIEVGDYVNGEEVTEVMRDEEGNVTDIVYTEEVEGQSYSLLPIKNIVTKEMFNSFKYEVK